MRKLGIVVAAAVVVSMLGIVHPLGIAPASAAPVAASRSCTVGGVTWQVNYTSWPDSGFGPLVKVDGLRRIEGASNINANSMTWEWREENPPSAYPPANPGPWILPYRSIRGGLDVKQPPWHIWQGRDWSSAYYSPRIVSPDGECTIYLTPFTNWSGNTGWPRVAVLGDSLTQQLNDSDYNQQQQKVQGYVEGLFNVHSIQAEVEGKGGAHWVETHEETHPPGGTPLPPLDRTNYAMLDEFRGLADHDPDGFVVALGVNDALGILVTGIDQNGLVLRPPAEVPGVRTEIHTKWMAALDEMTARTDCLVVVTAPEHSNHFAPGHANETVGINNLARWFDAQPALYPGLHVVDFALEAKVHRFGVPGEDSWFLEDNVHLNEAGRWVYTARITDAARECG